MSSEREPMTPAEVADFEAEFGDLPVSRLSHDRGADAEWEALRQDIIKSCGHYIDNAVFVQGKRRIEAALSVPAPTLPALDAEKLAEYITLGIMGERNGLGLTWNEAKALGSDIARRFVRDAV